MKRRPRWLIPAAVVAAGIAVAFAGMFYTGFIPSQDLSAEQRAAEQRRFEIGFDIFAVGVVVSTVGAAWLAVIAIRTRAANRHERRVGL